MPPYETSSHLDSGKQDDVGGPRATLLELPPNGPCGEALADCAAATQPCFRGLALEALDEALTCPRHRNNVPGPGQAQSDQVKNLVRFFSAEAQAASNNPIQIGPAPTSGRGHAFRADHPNEGAER